MTRRRAGLLSGFGPAALTAIVISFPIRVKAFAIRSQRANIVDFRVSKMRPIEGRQCCSGLGVDQSGRLGTVARRSARRGASLFARCPRVTRVPRSTVSAGGGVESDGDARGGFGPGDDGVVAAWFARGLRDEKEE